MSVDDGPAPGPAPEDCELCEAARTTDWFYEDELCWVAECEMCWVPMVVWRVHDPRPPEDLRAVMLAHLAEAVGREYTFEFYVDDNMRTIPEPLPRARAAARWLLRPWDAAHVARACRRWARS